MKKTLLIAFSIFVCLVFSGCSDEFGSLTFIPQIILQPPSDCNECSLTVNVDSLSKTDDGSELKTDDDFFMQLPKKFSDSTFRTDTDSTYKSYYYNFDSLESRQNVVINISAEATMNGKIYTYKATVSFDYLVDCPFDEYNNYKEIVLSDDSSNEIKAFITYHFWRTI